ncbi:hypothetical protein [Rummeliibacillus sp. SL167]|uniref:hypothetical protein n=1 Tax=Rummeliibacillus sp. SL167 TaxID=2579792 RepID=UPI0011B5CC97|nr:hypothetical protein [Rummeliibacillus sp. SL167]
MASLRVAIFRSTIIKIFTTVALIKVLDNFIGVTDTAENLVVRGIKTLIPGIPDWAATGIAKTLMMILPI